MAQVRQTTLAHARRQRGAAMLVALMILVVVSIVGVVAMRGSGFNAAVATGARAAMMVFQAAESGLAVVFAEASGDVQGDGDNVFNIVSSQLSLGALESIERCITTDNPLKPGGCAANDRYDSAGQLQASSRLAVNPTPQGPCNTELGQQVSSVGSEPIFSSYQFVAVGQGNMPAMGLTNHNVQEFTRCSPGGLAGGD